MHTTFLIAPTSAVVSLLPTGDDGEVLEPCIIRQVETQYLGPPKVKDIDDSSTEMEDINQGLCSLLVAHLHIELKFVMI